MKLHNYQQRAIEFCRKTDKAILAVGMGLGKSASILHYIDESKPASLLIVAPKRVAETVWKQEAEKWGLTEISDRLTIVAGTKAKRRKLIQSSDYLIIGRDNLADVAGMSFDILVMDELTSFKNPQSNRTDAICSIKAKKRIGLTGSFLTNGAIDCFGQFAAMGFGWQMTKKERVSAFYRWRATHFQDLLAGSGLQFHKWKLVTPLEQLIKNVRQNIFTLDSRDWLEIPDVQYFEHYVELSEYEMNEYLKLNTMLNCTLDDEIVSFNENQKFAKLQTLCNGFVYVDDGIPVRSEWSTKLDEVVDFVDRAVSEGEQVLLFYAFREEKVWLEEKMKKLHLKFTDVKDKRFMEKWNEGEVEVLLGHPQGASHGLNLHQSGARIMVFSTIPYDYEHFIQACGRLARQGQRRNTQIHSFMAKNTIEKAKMISLMRKSNILQEFIDITK
jgi:SNF2 family DNA or RNA helicase